MRKSAVIVIIAAVMLLASCGSAQKWPISAPERARLAEQGDPRAAQAVNTFGLELTRKIVLEKPDENVVVSPVSMAQALALTMNGAAGPTRDQMEKTLHVEGLSVQELNLGQRKLRDLLERPGPGITLSMANSLWLQQGWPFRKPYLDRVKSAYGAELNERKLSDPDVREEINKWVDKQTNGLITTMVDQPVSDDTKLMLLNALYFNGTWKTPFDQKETKDGDFTNSDGAVRRVPFMHQEGMYEYDESDAYQAVRLPYGDGQMGMLVVLPRPNADRKALTENLLEDPGFWTRRYPEFYGQLALPKFRMEGEFELKDTLSAMGMNLPFDPDKADFSEMSDTSADRKLFIKLVLHKTLIDVSERGTEAAAVTMVGMAGSAPPKGNFGMTVNRPFLFAIQDLQSGVLLFVGFVETP